MIRKVRYPYITLGTAVIRQALMDFWTQGKNFSSVGHSARGVYQSAREFFSPRNNRIVGSLSLGLTPEQEDFVSATQKFVAEGKNVSDLKENPWADMLRCRKKAVRRPPKIRKEEAEARRLRREERERISRIIADNYSACTSAELAAMTGLSVKGVENRIYLMRKRSVVL